MLRRSITDIIRPMKSHLSSTPVNRCLILLVTMFTAPLLLSAQAIPIYSLTPCSAELLNGPRSQSIREIRLVMIPDTMEIGPIHPAWYRGMQGIGEIVAPEPLPDYGERLWNEYHRQMKLKEDRLTGDEIEKLFCDLFSQFDCEYDFDPDVRLWTYVLLLGMMKEIDQVRSDPVLFVTWNDGTTGSYRASLTDRTLELSLPDSTLRSIYDRLDRRGGTTISLEGRPVYPSATIPTGDSLRIAELLEKMKISRPEIFRAQINLRNSPEWKGREESVKEMNRILGVDIALSYRAEDEENQLNELSDQIISRFYPDTLFAVDQMIKRLEQAMMRNRQVPSYYEVAVLDSTEETGWVLDYYDLTMATDDTLLRNFHTALLKTIRLERQAPKRAYAIYDNGELAAFVAYPDSYEPEHTLLIDRDRLLQMERSWSASQPSPVPPVRLDQFNPFQAGWRDHNCRDKRIPW